MKYTKNKASYREEKTKKYKKKRRTRNKWSKWSKWSMKKENPEIDLQPRKKP